MLSFNLQKCTLVTSEQALFFVRILNTHFHIMANNLATFFCPAIISKYELWYPNDQNWGADTLLAIDKIRANTYTYKTQNWLNFVNYDVGEQYYSTRLLNLNSSSNVAEKPLYGRARCNIVILASLFMWPLVRPPPPLRQSFRVGV